MKKLLFVFAILIGFQPARAQLFTKENVQNLQNFDKKRWSWGFYLGLNKYDFKFDYKKNTNLKNTNFQDIKVKTKMGFNVGIVGDFRINDYIDLRLEPGVMFVKRQLIFPTENAIYPNGNVRDVKSTYIYIPFLVKFSTKRINNFKPFVEGGISTSINLSSNENNADDNRDGVFRMKTNTYYWEVGFGIDFYLPYFKFTPSIRGIFAMNNELVPDDDPNSPYTGNIDKMATRGIFLNLTFQ